MGNEECPVHLDLLWQTEVSSSIYSTPLVSDINRCPPSPLPIMPPSSHLPPIIPPLDTSRGFVYDLSVYDLCVRKGGGCCCVLWIASYILLLPSPLRRPLSWVCRDGYMETVIKSLMVLLQSPLLVFCLR